MSQQIDNNNFLRHIVFMNCRSCLCFKNEKHDFEFNIVIEKRYHKQTMHDKKQINNEMTSQKIKDFCKKKICD